MPDLSEPSSSILDADASREVLRAMWRSRLGDLREQSLIRQGKGWFHISGMGHEALATMALFMEAEDYAFPITATALFVCSEGLAMQILLWPFSRSAIPPVEVASSVGTSVIARKIFGATRRR